MFFRSKKQNNDKRYRYSIRKFGRLVGSVAVGAFFLSNASLVAADVQSIHLKNADYTSLTTEERNMIHLGAPSFIANGEQPCYVLVYKPVGESTLKVLPKTGSNPVLDMVLLGAGAASMALAGWLIWKNQKSGKYLLIAVISAAGVASAPDALAAIKAIAPAQVFQFTKDNQMVQVSPDTIEGFEYVGYMTTDCDVLSTPPATSTPPVVSTPPATSTPPVVSTPPATSTPPAATTPPVTPTPPVAAIPPVTPKAQEVSTTAETKGSVIIKYQSVDGKELAPDKEDTMDAVVSTTTKVSYTDEAGKEVVISDITTPSKRTYNAAEGDEKPATITKDNVVYHLISSSNNETGDVKEGITTVIYTYAPEVVKVTEKTGSVVIKYQDVNGNELAPDKEDTGNTIISETTRISYTDASGKEVVVSETTKDAEAIYNATEGDEKPATITKDNVVYHLISSSNNETGDVKEGVTTVIYTYAPGISTTTETKGSVTIKYQSVDGKELQADKADTTDAVVSTTTKVSYTDEAGKEVTASNVTTPSKKTYDATEVDEKPATITKDNVVYHLISSSNNETGDVKEGMTTVVYTYAPEVTKEIEKTGSVVIKYQDTKGNELAPDKEDTGNTIISQITRTSYTDANGKEVIVSEAIKDAELIYNATEGDEKPEIIKKDNVFYRLVSSTNNETGDVKEGVTTVIYTYEAQQMGSHKVTYKLDASALYTKERPIKVFVPGRYAETLEIIHYPMDELSVFVNGKKIPEVNGIYSAEIYSAEGIDKQPTNMPYTFKFTYQFQGQNFTDLKDLTDYILNDYNNFLLDTKNRVEREGGRASHLLDHNIFPARNSSSNVYMSNFNGHTSGKIEDIIIWTAMALE